jgi:hypothetical protein
VPVFGPGRRNTFEKCVDHPSEWAWEPHSAECRLDESVGFSDRCSVTIRKQTRWRTAWYTRALGEDYHDHRPLTGRFEIRAMVRTQGLTGRARIGVRCYNGPECLLYSESGGTTVYSAAVSGTHDWTRRRIAFEAKGYGRFKIILEQEGSGQSWFDDVELVRLDQSDA